MVFMVVPHHRPPGMEPDRKAMRLPIRASIAILCLLSPQGCTQAVVDYAGKSEIRESIITEIESAWRAEDGDMVLCLRGWPAERSRSVPPVRFHLSVPLGLFEDPDQPSPLLIGDEDSRIRTMVIPQARIATGCPKRPAGASDIRTIVVAADYFASVSPRMASDPQIERFADPDAADVALFGFEAPSDPPALALLYRDDDVVFGGSRLVWIDLGEKAVKPNEAAYLALPVAFAADVGMVLAFIAVLALSAAAALAL